MLTRQVLVTGLCFLGAGYRFDFRGEPSHNHGPKLNDMRGI